MHGGSGLSREDTRAAIRAGIRKINYFSYMSNAGVRAVEALIAEKHPKYFHALANAATAAMQADAEAAMDSRTKVRFASAIPRISGTAASLADLLRQPGDERRSV